MTLSFALVSPQDGYGLIALLVGLESMGLPVPGEITMVSAAIYAATSGRIRIEHVIIAGAAGAVLGGIVGYTTGRLMGPPLLAEYGPRLGLSTKRQKLGRFLFCRYGAIIVFASRFFTLARNFTGLLAGANQMPVGRFMIWNVLGGAAWPAIHCSIAYTFGEHTTGFSHWAWAAVAALLICWLFAAAKLAHKHEERLHRMMERQDL